MCIFTGRVRSVANTNIFARLSGRGTQFLVYSMRYAADRPVAMILPLPVASPERRIGIRFINLKNYADFFNDVENGFPRPPMAEESVGGGRATAMMAARPIHVESVGDFIASYVPTLNDFSRLDKRFTLPRSTWDQIPQYHDYGFAVFQLRKSTPARRLPVEFESEGPVQVHPMAFEFHTRLPGTLYFPTVHIHDERVHPREDFDHALYMQDARLASRGRSGLFSFASQAPLPATPGLAKQFVEIAKTQGAVDPNQKCYKQTLNGELPNRDTLIRVA